MFDLQEEALDKVALAVEDEIAGYLWRCRPGRNDRYGVLVFDGVPERLGIVAFIAQDMVGGKVGDQGFGLGDVARLPRRQDKA